MIRAEIEASNAKAKAKAKAKELADEQGIKTAQNVAAGVVGIVVWPIWFGMDFKGRVGSLPRRRISLRHTSIAKLPELFSEAVIRSVELISSGRLSL